MENKKYLPMYGVGLVYVAVIISVAAAAMIAGYNTLFEKGIINGVKN